MPCVRKQQFFSSDSFELGYKIMKHPIGVFFMLLFCLSTLPVYAVDVAPRISDVEIIERLTRLEEGQKRLDDSIKTLDINLNKRIDDVNKRIDDGNRDLNKRIDDSNKELNNRIDDLRSEMNSRFDTLQWMFGVFITVALLIFGFILRMQWQMHRRQTQMETILETQRDELGFIKGLIEKLLPPKGVL